MNTASEKKTLNPLREELLRQQADMQGLLVRGYKSLKAASYILLDIEDVAAAKEYFSYLANNYITNAGKKQKSDAPSYAVNIAFTGRGLKKLLPENILATFSREFKEGMSYSYCNEHNKLITERSTLLGDFGGNSPENWHWGNPMNPVDCVLLVYATDTQALHTLIKEMYCYQKKGVKQAYVANTFEYDPEKIREHFGFRDGISQPIIKGLSKENDADKRALINPGEFILGYRNEYNDYSPGPYVDDDMNSKELPSYSHSHPCKKDLGKNGTYLVFRQIEQQVEAFWDFMYDHSKETAASKTEKAVKLAAKMIGRWPDGRPLVTTPSADCALNNDSITNFGYAETDKDGLRCPLGAHIRRTNPRDQVHTGRGKKDSLQMSKRHRMLRRGRIYGEPLDKDFDIDNMIHRRSESYNNHQQKNDTAALSCVKEGNDHCTRGIHFMCLVSDISRQFEFVQNVWANTSTFADLCNEVDPIISPRATAEQQECHEFNTPQYPIRNRYLNVPAFTKVVGGAYFFMPGILALNFIIR